MHFQEIRNIVMKRFNWDRRVATLAVRIANDIESFDTIARTPSFRGNPLLLAEEEKQIKRNLDSIRGMK